MYTLNFYKRINSYYTRTLGIAPGNFFREKRLTRGSANCNYIKTNCIKGTSLQLAKFQPRHSLNRLEKRGSGFNLAIVRALYSAFRFRHPSAAEVSFGKRASGISGIGRLRYCMFAPTISIERVHFILVYGGVGVLINKGMTDVICITW